MDSTLVGFERAIKDEGVKPYLIKLLLLAALYMAGAQVGLSLSVTFEHITPIWPASGIALTALLLWGYHYWPGIFVGAFMINSLMGISPAVATGIALGNTLEAVIAVFLIWRFIAKGEILESITGSVVFVLLAPILSSMIAAIIGTSSLLLGDAVSSGEAREAWLTWWVGDMMGILIIVPFVVAWYKREYREQLSGHVYEALALLLVVVMVSLLIFTESTHTSRAVLPFVYVLFPLIILAAVRFAQIGAVTAGMVITLASVWGTLANKGPYSTEESIEANIFSLHFFLFIIMFTALVLSVAVYGRLKSEKALVKKATELAEAKEQIIRNIEWRKDLQAQMNDATSKINDILTSVLDEAASDKPPRGLEK